ncbi:MAG TPA: hypothetical protein VF085_11500 [Solirubrobacterales bacterium]
MKTKRLVIFLLTRVFLLTLFVAPAVVIGKMLAAPGIVISCLVIVVNLAFWLIEEDLIDRIAPRFGVTQLNGR